MTTQTEQTTQIEVRPGYCPKCDAQLKYEQSPDRYDGGILWEMTCPGCGTQLQEQYDEVFWGFSIPDEDGNYTGEMEYLAPKANARLIAAAPELLNACKRVLEKFRSTELDDPKYLQCVAAIAKATGEAT